VPYAQRYAPYAAITARSTGDPADAVMALRDAIRAADPSQTALLGNFRYSYRNKKIDISRVSWLKKIFRTAHTKMEYDPEVWGKVEELILEEVRRSRDEGIRGSAPAQSL